MIRIPKKVNLIMIMGKIPVYAPIPVPREDIFVRSELQSDESVGSSCDHDSAFIATSSNVEHPGTD